MKRKLILFTFLIWMSSIASTSAKVVSHRTGNYMFVNRVMQEVILYEEEETHMPVYKISYSGDD